MTFLQPFILWALPLALFPVVLHFLNRMRHRTVPWGAMMFLLSATRSSTRNAKLRQFLILTCRVMAVAALVLAMARPLAQGWWGGSMPDVIVLVLDRSASMEMRMGETTKRQAAIRRLAKAAKKYTGRSRLVLLDSVTREPQDIGALDVLDQLAITAPTDTAADIPALLKIATEWLAGSQAGPAEIWVASDFQSSNWQANTARWTALEAQMTSLPQGVRLRLLDLSGAAGADASVSVVQANRRFRDGESWLDLAIGVESEVGGERGTLPVTVAVDDARIRLDVPANGSRALLRHTVDLGTRKAGGWGVVELPADANARNNRAYFVYPPIQAVEAAVVSDSDSVARLLRLAAAPDDPERTNRVARLFPSTEQSAMPWERLALILWQAPFPEGPMVERLKQFVEEGGTLVFFPPGGVGDAGVFERVTWKDMERAEEGETFRVVSWDRDRGPLADSQEGIGLPVDALTVAKRRVPTGNEGGVLASFEGGAAFLVRRAIGRGEVLFVATLPVDEWSNLGDGPVLVPMLQRLFEAGTERLSPHRTVAMGEWVPEDVAAWMPVGSDKAQGTVGENAGVYRSGAELVAVNRPASEDLPETLGREEVGRLLGEVPFKWFGDDAGTFRMPEGELWRLLVGAMLCFLMLEGWLSLPARGKRITEKPQVASDRPLADVA